MMMMMMMTLFSVFYRWEGRTILPLTQSSMVLEVWSIMVSVASLTVASLYCMWLKLKFCYWKKGFINQQLCAAIVAVILFSCLLISPWNNISQPTSFLHPCEDVNFSHSNKLNSKFPHIYLPSIAQVYQRDGLKSGARAAPVHSHSARWWAVLFELEICFANSVIVLRQGV